MTYNFDINNRAFNAIKNRTKRVEIRCTKIGDNHFNYSILIINYKTVEELLTLEGTRYTLSSTNDFNEGVKSINSLDGYTESIKVNGVYAIHIKYINNM